MDAAVTVVVSAASIQSPGVRSRGENVFSVEAKTGLFAVTRTVTVSVFAVPDKLDAPTVTV